LTDRWLIWGRDSRRRNTGGRARGSGRRRRTRQHERAPGTARGATPAGLTQCPDRLAQRDPADLPGPYAAIAGIGLLGSTGAGQPNYPRCTGPGASPHAFGLTFRDVSIKGFDIQVELGSFAFLLSFERTG
jgi:hypothetical protein